MPKTKAAEPDAGRIDAIITVADEAVATMPAIVKALGKHGFAVSEVMDSLGLISGSAPKKGLAKMREVKGVKAVEVSGEMQIAPPESDIQ